MRRLLALSLSTVLLAACSGGASEAPPTAEAEAPPPPAEPAPEAEADPEGDPLERMRAVIEEQKARPEQEATTVKVRHILIGFAGAPRMEVERTRDEAEELAARIYVDLVGGADFAALMQEYSDDPGSGVYAMTTTTPMGRSVMPRRQMVPGFGNTAWRLEVGEFGVAPHHERRSPYGWHVMQRIQ